MVKLLVQTKSFICGMPSASIWHVMILSLTIATWGRYYYDPHFTGEETELHKRISSFPKLPWLLGGEGRI